MTKPNQLEVILKDSECSINYDPNHPPDVFFDTNVWCGMNDEDIDTLNCLQQKREFCYRYSTINFIELISHLDDTPLKNSSNPFARFQSCFRKIIKLCQKEILPTPELEFLQEAGLEKYIDPVWIPDPDQVALVVKAITNAKNISELDGLHISHYKRLRGVDQTSLQAVMKDLENFTQPIIENVFDEINKWFMKWVNFFLLIRPSNNKISYSRLNQKEQSQFQSMFIRGAGQIFHMHCCSRIKNIVNYRKNIDPNDLYDMLQLILLRDVNRLFVTNDKSFFQYKTVDSTIQRVVYWDKFRKHI